MQGIGIGVTERLTRSAAVLFRFLRPVRPHPQPGVEILLSTWPWICEACPKIDTVRCNRTRLIRIEKVQRRNVPFQPHAGSV